MCGTLLGLSQNRAADDMPYASCHLLYTFSCETAYPSRPILELHWNHYSSQSSIRGPSLSEGGGQSTKHRLRTFCLMTTRAAYIHQTFEDTRTIKTLFTRHDPAYHRTCSCGDRQSRVCLRVCLPGSASVTSESFWSESLKVDLRSEGGETAWGHGLARTPCY